MARDKSIISSPRALGAFIHDARIERNLTQESLATLAGVSRSWLIGVEQGKRQRAEFDKILNVLEALNINLVLERQSAEQPSAPQHNTGENKVPTFYGTQGLQAAIAKSTKEALGRTETQLNSISSMLENPGLDSLQNLMTTLAPSDDITNMLKTSVPNFGQASGITQALNRQNQKNKTGNSSE